MYQGKLLPEGAGTRLLQNDMCTYSFDVGAERNNCNAFGIDNEVMKFRGWGLVWNNSFGSMISYSTFYRNKIFYCCS